MTLVDTWKALTRPAVWLARHATRGLTAIGLSMHGRPYQDTATGPTTQEADSAEAVRTKFRDDAVSVARLTPDELLWQAELEERP